jgi:N-acetyl-1-D-myo-inositol-2-amino-2-deoxy-alpha-D-glucopyranoside deacetylase
VIRILIAMSRSGVLFVHAHPDDESIGTGATMARYAAAGVPVTLVTCTLGELGEVIPPGLAYLAAGREDRLGGYRIGELDAACAALGVTDHRFLGGPGRWRDSGMMGLPSNDDPRCFWQADLGEASAALAAIVREVAPAVMVSYDAHGFYGHPDHIQAHRVAWRAFQLAGGVAKFYATALPRSVLAAAISQVTAGGMPPGFLVPASPDDLPHTPDEMVTTQIDGRAFQAAKAAAMAAHATQIIVRGDCFALSNGVGQPLLGQEFYTRLAGPGPAGPPGGPGGASPLGGPGGASPLGGPVGASPSGGAAGGWEYDLFAGLPDASG